MSELVKLLHENETLFRKVQKLQEQRGQLRSALRSLKRDNTCFCRHDDSRPLDARHSDICKMVTRVLEETEK